MAVEEERGLSDAYRVARQGPQPQGQGLNDLYVRFFRMAERQIVEHTGQGVVSFISNYSWLDGLSHPAMRERFLTVFDQIRIDNLQGDKYRTGKLTPEGEPDPSAFSTPQNREGIQVGTAIATLIRTREEGEEASATVLHRSWWGHAKLQELDGAQARLDAPVYDPLAPQLELGWAFGGKATASAYLAWPRLPELFPVSYPGIMTSRDSALVDVDRAALETHMQRYFDPEVNDADISREMPALMVSTTDFDAPKVRKTLLKRGYGSGRVARYAYRPFDTRWLYWHPETKLLDRNRLEYLPQVFPGNHWICAVQQNRKGYDPSTYTTVLGSRHVIERGANWFPLKLRQTTEDLLGTHTSDRPNLSPAAAGYLAGLKARPEDLFFHALAVLHSPAYRAENAGALCQDWPRIPLPATLAALAASADLGRRVATLLDTETPVAGVTAGDIHPELRPLAAIARRDGQPLQEADFALTAGWGHAGKEGVTMPGRGRTEVRAVADGTLDAALGRRVVDVYLNDRACWRDLPEPVWEYTLGGYQVLKKWLSYREQPLLGRPLSLDEIKEFTAHARRIAALVLLRGQLDAAYRTDANL